MAIQHGLQNRSGHYGSGRDMFVVPVNSLTVGEKTPIATTFKKGDVITDVYLVVRTAEATAGTKSIDIGFNAAAGVDDDPNGLMALAPTSAVGTVIGLLLGTDTLGALLKEDTNGSTVNVRKPFVITQTDTVLTYTLASEHTELVADIYVEFFRPIVGP